MQPYLTASRTDRVIRVPSALGWTSDHRHCQVESEFRTHHNSRVDLQRDERYRVHVRVSYTTGLPFFHIFFINSRETPTGTGTQRRSGTAVWGGTWGSAVLGVSFLRERSRIALEGFSGLDSYHQLPAGGLSDGFILGKVATFILFFYTTIHNAPPTAPLDRAGVPKISLYIRKAHISTTTQQPGRTSH